MLKKLVLALFAVFLLPLPLASVQVFSPVESVLSDQAELSLPSLQVQPGEKILLVLGRFDPRDAGSKWDRLSPVASTFPSDWVLDAKVKDQSLEAVIQVPISAQEDTRRLAFEVGNGLRVEHFSLLVRVRGGLLGASLQESSQSASLGGKTVFQLSLQNASIASHAVKVSSSLPEGWMAEKRLTVPAKDTVVVALEMTPRLVQNRDFVLFVTSQENGSVQELPAKVRVLPSLKGSFLTPLAAFPFFPPALYPFYLLDSLLALLS